MSGSAPYPRPSCDMLSLMRLSLHVDSHPHRETLNRAASKSRRARDCLIVQERFGLIKTMFLLTNAKLLAVWYHPWSTTHNLIAGFTDKVFAL
jgi:hypothetical protein